MAYIFPPHVVTPTPFLFEDIGVIGTQTVFCGSYLSAVLNREASSLPPQITKFVPIADTSAPKRHIFISPKLQTFFNSNLKGTNLTLLYSNDKFLFKVNTVHVIGLFLYPLKTSENQSISIAFKGVWKGNI